LQGFFLCPDAARGLHNVARDGSFWHIRVSKTCHEILPWPMGRLLLLAGIGVEPLRDTYAARGWLGAVPAPHKQARL